MFVCVWVGIEGRVGRREEEREGKGREERERERERECVL